MSYTAVINPNLPNSYSTLNGIYLQNDNANASISFNIQALNPECQFERLETIENIDEMFPNGSLIVRDTRDIISFISNNQINKILFTFLDGTTKLTFIHSTSYITNAASENEENMVSINFSNRLYKVMQQTALIDLLPYHSPKVFRVSDFVNDVASALGTSARVVNDTSNYMVYRPYTTSDTRIEHPCDNPLQYLNYVTSFASGLNTQRPRFMLWTNWSGELVFKYFEESVYDDPYSSDAYLTQRGLRYKIYDSNNENLRFTSQNGKFYKKIYYMCTDPADQFISKNYYYVRKTPKILDKNNFGPSPDPYTPDNMEALLYQYQDEGQKYNVEMVSSNGTNSMVPGADEIRYDKEWGYFNTSLTPTDDGRMALLGQDFGSAKQYDDLLINGNCGYFQYVDNTEMWKMLFDYTEVHPHYPDTNSLLDSSTSGTSTNLQKILDIRYEAFNQDLLNAKARLETFRKIEKENFIMYVLCCMSKEENSFFAKITGYEVDKTFGSGLTGACGGVPGPTFIPYKYNWVRLNFNSPYGLTGPIDPSSNGSGGSGYYFNNIESWEEDLYIKGNSAQDETWAINLNERGVNSIYLPPGWISSLPQGFRWRPIGALSDVRTSAGATSGSANHIVKMYSTPVSEFLLDSRQPVPSNYIGKYLYYFSAENVVDGTCTQTTLG